MRPPDAKQTRKTPDPSQVATVKADAHLNLFAELFPRGETSPSAPPADVPRRIRAAMDDPDRRFGRYVRAERLGQGGMAEVWKAWDLALGRWVALKFLKYDDSREAARFRQEALVAARLSHPNIAAIYGAEEARGKPFIAMQYVAGRTLRVLAPAAALAARLLRDAALAVHAAHERGVIHRDLKPDNLMVEGLPERSRSRKSSASPTLHLYVMDFGLAKHVEFSSGLSTAGTLLGTPLYMSPEQARGRRALDRRTDIYSLGATLYEMVTGRPLFTGVNPYDLIRKVVEEEPVPPRKIRPSLDRDLETIVLKCLQKDPARRYATALALAQDLSRWLEGRAIRARESSLLRRSAGGPAPASAERRSRPIRYRSALLKLQRQGAEDLASALRSIAEIDARTLEVERVSVWLFDKSFSRLECLELYRRSHGAHEGAPSLHARLYPRYFRAMRTDRVVAADDARLDPRTREFARDYLVPLGITSMIDAPIRREGRLVGVLCHEHTGPRRAWTIEEEEFVSSVADLVSAALESSERRRVETELRRRTPRVKAFQSTLLRLSKLDASDLGPFLRAAAETASRALGAERVSVWHFNGGRTRLQCLELYRRSAGAHESGASLESRLYPRYFQALEASRVVAAHDARTDARTREFTKDYLEPLGITSMMDVTLRRGGRPAGVVCCEHTGPRREWTLEEQEFASSVADLVSAAIEASDRRVLEEEVARLRRAAPPTPPPRQGPAPRSRRRAPPSPSSRRGP